jgi:hypothetical protein
VVFRSFIITLDKTRKILGSSNLASVGSAFNQDAVSVGLPTSSEVPHPHWDMNVQNR